MDRARRTGGKPVGLAESVVSCSAICVHCGVPFKADDLCMIIAGPVKFGGNPPTEVYHETCWHEYLGDLYGDWD